jgi:hypothetical protein
MAEETPDETSEEVPNGDEKTGIKKLLANKIIVISAAAVLVLLLAAGSYFLFFSGSDDEALSDEDVTDSSDDLNDESGETETIELDIIPPEGDTNADALDESGNDSDKSKLEKISDQVKADAAKLLGEPSDQAQASSSEDLDSQQSKLQQELKELKQQNQQLKTYIKDMDGEVPPVDLSIPIDELAHDGQAAKSQPLLDNPYVNLEPYDTNDYFSSPYADDEQTPEPTWGE